MNVVGSSRVRTQANEKEPLCESVKKDILSVERSLGMKERFDLLFIESHILDTFPQPWYFLQNLINIIKVNKILYINISRDLKCTFTIY